MAVVKDVFLKTGWCDGVFKNVVLEPLTHAVGERLFNIMSSYGA